MLIAALIPSTAPAPLSGIHQPVQFLCPVSGVSQALVPIYRCPVFFNETKSKDEVSRYWLWDFHFEPYLDIPLDGLSADLSLPCPIGFAFLLGLSFQVMVFLCNLDFN